MCSQLFCEFTDENMNLKYINVHHYRCFNLLQALDPKIYDENTEITKKEKQQPQSVNIFCCYPVVSQGRIYKGLNKMIFYF